MSVPTFTVLDEFDRTETLADTLYQIGVDNPRTELNACTPVPYTSREDVSRMLNGKLSLLLVVDNIDDSIAGIVQYDVETGKIERLINRYYLSPEGEYTEKGNELIRVMVEGIRVRSESGRAVSQSPNPNDHEAAVLLGLEFDE